MGKEALSLGCSSNFRSKMRRSCSWCCSKSNVIRSIPHNSEHVFIQIDADEAASKKIVKKKASSHPAAGASRSRSAIRPIFSPEEGAALEKVRQSLLFHVFSYSICNLLLQQRNSTPISLFLLLK